MFHMRWNSSCLVNYRRWFCSYPLLQTINISRWNIKGIELKGWFVRVRKIDLIQSKWYTTFASNHNNKPVGSCGVLSYLDKIGPNIISIAIEIISSSIGNSTLKCTGRILKSCNNAFNPHKTRPKKCLLAEHSASRHLAPCPWTMFLVWQWMGQGEGTWSRLFCMLRILFAFYGFCRAQGKWISQRLPHTSSASLLISHNNCGRQFFFSCPGFLNIISESQKLSANKLK